MNSSMLLKSTKTDGPSATKLNRYERSHSIKSNKISASKTNSANITQKIIIQESHLKRKNLERTPLKYGSAYKATKSLHKSQLEKGGSKTLRKTTNQREKHFMTNSINIPYLSPSFAELTKSNIQKLPVHFTSKNSSSIYPNTLTEIFSKTSQTLQQYQKMCRLLTKQNKEMERKLLKTKNKIALLQRQASLKRRKSCECV